MAVLDVLHLGIYMFRPLVLELWRMQCFWARHDKGGGGHDIQLLSGVLVLTDADADADGGGGLRLRRVLRSRSQGGCGMQCSPVILFLRMKENGALEPRC